MHHAASQEDPGRTAMIGESPAFLGMLDLISRLAPVDRPVLILGERGSGKELVTERLHYLSGRWDGPLIRTNCAALAEGVLDSELFGHEAGAFTGAMRRHAGRFERAAGGTLFLDEIASAPARVQEKLLRAVEYGEIERVGGSNALKIDVRVVAAANVDLRAAVRDGKFRADLLDRLAFDVVRVPPLRERREDIPVLVDHFGRAMAADLDWPTFPGFTEEAMADFSTYPWPGNIRELRSAVERSMVRAGDGDKPVASAVLDPFGGPNGEPPDLPSGPAAPSAPLAHSNAEDVGNPAADLTAAARRSIAASGPYDHRALLAAIEQSILDTALAKSGNSLKKTSIFMSLSYDQLRSIMKKHNRRIR